MRLRVVVGERAGREPATPPSAATPRTLHLVRPDRLPNQTAAPVTDPTTGTHAMLGQLLAATYEVLAEVKALAETLGRPAESPAWLDVAGAAKHLGCGERRIYDLVQRHRATGFPFHKPAGRLLFSSSELDRWVEGS